MRFLYFTLSILWLFIFNPQPSSAVKDLRTKEQRLYDIKLRNAQWKVNQKQLDKDTKESTFVEIQDLFDQNISTLENLNRREREYRQAQLAYDQAVIALKNTRLSFLRDATHITIREAKKYRTAEGYRQIEITLENTSNLSQAMSLTPNKNADAVRALLEIQNIRISIKGNNNLIIAEPYEIAIPSLKLNQRKNLTFRLLSDYESVHVSLRQLDKQILDYPIVLRRESRQDIPTINSVQFSQEGDLNSRIKYDIILERLAEDEKNFRLAVVNLPKEIDLNFIDPSTAASLTQVKFSEETTRQQLELEVQIPEKLSRRFIDKTIEFYVFITDKAGFQQIGQLNREYGSKFIPLEKVNTINGNKERFELIPRGEGALEIIITNRYQEIKTDEEVAVRIDLLNTGTLEVDDVHLILTLPLGWTHIAIPDTIRHILPGEKEPVNITLTPPADLGVSEYDVRIEAAGFVGNERVDAQEKDLAVRVEAQANIFRNTLVVMGVIILIVVIVSAFIKVSRR